LYVWLDVNFLILFKDIASTLMANHRPEDKVLSVTVR
jgi:hypothetical protein